MEWYSIDNIDQLDTPALVVYPERVKENIRILKQFVPDVNRLRPHVKTNKCAEVCQLMIDEGINQFKCATIAEAEMLATLKAKDVLLAYQPVGPKRDRLINLMITFPETKFSCLIDDLNLAQTLSEQALEHGLVISVFIDLNVGMNRTGTLPENSMDLYVSASALKGIKIIGLHAYDGHLRDTDLSVRKSKCDDAYSKVENLHQAIKSKFNKDLTIIAGGTPTFPIHAGRKNIQCSPGTFIFWDRGYQQLLPEQPFLFAALVVTRVISTPSSEVVTLDLGHKAIASENPITNRVYFLNAEDAQPIGHSEEHLVLKTQQTKLKTGDVLYGVPHHICPTVALYENMSVIENNRFTKTWNVVSRKRRITI